MLRFVVMTLATMRLALMLSKERGPLNSFRNLREHFGIEEDDDGNLISAPDDGGIGAGLSCFWCTSVWAATAIVSLELVAPKVNDVLAVSGGAIVIKEQVLSNG